MKRGRKPKLEEDDLEEDKILEEFRGNKLDCSCADDPDWCPKHQFFV